MTNSLLARLKPVMAPLLRSYSLKIQVTYLERNKRNNKNYYPAQNLCPLTFKQAVVLSQNHRDMCVGFLFRYNQTSNK